MLRNCLFLFGFFIWANEPLSPEKLWELSRVGAPALQPGGNWVATVVSDYSLQENSGKSAIWLVSLDGKKQVQLTQAGKRNHTPMWSADGKTLFFVSNRNGSYQIFQIDLGGGEAKQVTFFDFSVANVKLMADGSGFLFTRNVKLDPLTTDVFPDLPKASGRVFDQLMYRHWDSWSDGTYSHLHSCDLKGANLKDWMQGMKVDTPLKPFGGSEQFTSSPDGKWLVYSAKVSDFPARSTDSDLYLINRTSGEVQNITEGMDGYDLNPVFSPDSNWLAFNSMEKPGYEADRNRIMLYDMKKKSIKELTTNLDKTVSHFEWSADPSRILFTAPHHGNYELYTLEVKSGKVDRLFEFNGNVRAWSEQGKSMAVSLSSHLRPAEIFRLDGSKVVAISDFNGEHYQSLELPSYEAKWIEASDGKQIHNWIFYPPGFDPQKKYPLIMYCQGGPQSMISQSFSFRWNFHLMTSQGYVVCAVNRRGLPGFGQDWNYQISKDWGGQAMQDILSATDYMQAQPFIDKDRTAAVGASFGGYTIYWLMGHDQENRFASMIAHAGLFNLESMYAATEELFFVDHDLGGPFWQSAELKAAYEKHSPHEFVGNWDTPLLVIHGQLDFRVPVTEGMQAFTAAQVQGVPSKFLYFPDEGHWILTPQNGVMWQRVFFSWLSETLE